ncbi:MAG: hypothetical protein KatS3mg110_2736 [Pirellulaceae bacterium]|nr:MAG: hypothetical protein KatS3mg110_2736 [Pirellulaceae bacterium]
MSVVLLDMTVGSLLHPDKKGNPLQAGYEKHMKAQKLAVTFQSVPELWQCAETTGWGQEARQRRMVL